MAYCYRCNRHFLDFRALEQHKDNSKRHWVCGPCGIDFSSWADLESHYIQSSEHAYCHYCDEHFDDNNELLAHYQNEHFMCVSCEKPHLNRAEYEAHMRQRHFYCVPCARLFNSRSNLEAHQNSSTHKPKEFRCPGAGCGGKFVSAAALVQHWDAGACRSGFTRDAVNREIVRADSNNIITNPSRLIRNADSSVSTSTSKIWATNLSWNGSAFECFLCHKAFRALPHLNSHMQSPRHLDKIYHCPNRSGCGIEFSTLSALCQHVEHDRCGVKRFSGVREAMDSFVKGVRRITT